jgi:hypothetical protein
MDTIINDILTELRTYPLTPTAYHKKLNCGTSLTFGLIPKRISKPELSAISCERAKLYSLLKKLSDSLNIEDYTSITIQHNYSLIRRKEKSGDKAFLFIIGNYEDNGISINNTVINKHNEVVELNTSQDSIIPSRVVSGNRYVIIYHKITSEPFEVSFVEKGGSIQLQCGELSALPGNRFSFYREEKNIVINFD